MKTILVTGAAGFIGVHLCEELLGDSNNLVVGMDNLITGSSDNIDYLSKYKNFTMIICDIINKQQLFNELNKVDSINEIYHLASIASPKMYMRYPLETMDVNVLGTRNLLEYIGNKPIKFLLTSTSEVYGDPEIHPQKENYYGNVNTVGIRSCYDESKRCAETYVHTFRQLYNQNSKIVRIFNTYGPKMSLNDGRVITNFISNILENKPINIYGDGKQTRSFCYVTDMVDGLIKMMSSDERGPINLGNPNHEINMLQLKDEFEKTIGRTIQCNYVEKYENDPMVRKPDIGLAKNKLNFDPKTNIVEGLYLTWNYYASQKIS